MNDVQSLEVPEVAIHEPETPIPASHEPGADLLEDLVSVWGNAVGVDDSTARALILTVVGGVAGNSVRINVPRVGELGADIQIAVDRDKAPGLRRGMQRLLSGYESTILAALKRYDHLSTRRAQKQELSLLETELRMIRLTYGAREVRLVAGQAVAVSVPEVLVGGFSPFGDSVFLLHLIHRMFGDPFLEFCSVILGLVSR